MICQILILHNLPNSYPTVPHQQSGIFFYPKPQGLCGGYLLKKVQILLEHLNQIRTPNHEHQDIISGFRQSSYP